MLAEMSKQDYCQNKKNKKTEFSKLLGTWTQEAAFAITIIIRSMLF